MTKNSKQIDLLAMNVTWFPKDFEVYDNQVGIMEATILTTGILDFRSFDFRDYWFNAVYNSILFSSPLVLLSNLDLRGFCFCAFLIVSPD